VRSQVWTVPFNYQLVAIVNFLNITPCGRTLTLPSQGHPNTSFWRYHTILTRLLLIVFLSWWLLLIKSYIVCTVSIIEHKLSNIIQNGSQSKLFTHKNIDIKFFFFVWLALKFSWQGLAASMDEGDIAKFTDAIKTIDSITLLVLSIGNFVSLF
jgi:hypothetical protein